MIKIKNKPGIWTYPHFKVQRITNRNYQLIEAGVRRNFWEDYQLENFHIPNPEIETFFFLIWVFKGIKNELQWILKWRNDLIITLFDLCNKDNEYKYRIIELREDYDGDINEVCIWENKRPDWYII
jgi:hypothetical protein